MAEMKTNQTEVDINQLLDESAAIMQRWKKASAQVLADSLGIGAEIVPHVHTAAHAFQQIMEKLSGYGHIDGKERDFF